MLSIELLWQETRVLLWTKLMEGSQRVAESENPEMIIVSNFYWSKCRNFKCALYSLVATTWIIDFTHNRASCKNDILTDHHIPKNCQARFALGRFYGFLLRLPSNNNVTKTESVLSGGLERSGGQEPITQVFKEAVPWASETVGTGSGAGSIGNW